MIIWLVFAFFVVVASGLYKTFEKAGQPGWAAFAPGFNVVVWLRASGRPLWWGLALLVPGVGFVFAYRGWASLARAFGKGPAFATGLLLLPAVFVPWLGFGDADYRGPRYEE